MPPDTMWLVDGSKQLCHSLWLRDSQVFAPQSRIFRYASGIPPAWVHDSSGASLWAVHLVFTLTPVSLRICTNCQGVPIALKAGAASNTAPPDILARTWAMIANALHWDFTAGASIVVWMPHASAQAVGNLRDNREPHYSTYVERQTAGRHNCQAHG